MAAEPRLSRASPGEVRGQGEKPLLHIWSECYNLTRRVLAITDHSEQRLALAVERFGRVKPDRLEFIRKDFQRQSRELSRQEFCERMKIILAQQFPDETLESLVISEDLEYSLPGTYARGVLKRGSMHTAVIAVSENEAPDTIGRVLSFGLLWLERLRAASKIRGTLSGLRVILPAASVRLFAHVCGAISESVGVRMFALDPRLEILEEINITQAGNIDSWLMPCREFQDLLDRANGLLVPVIALAPRAIPCHPGQSATITLRFRGLPFALYRAQPERWLEALIREDVTRIDARLDPKFVYTQVFAVSAGAHGVLDILCATRSGRLAILELKASENINLPLQAAEYWLRIQRHLQQGDFPRCGYFPGVELQKAPPLVYLVAPALRFHPTTDVLLRYLVNPMEVLRVGLAESWRRGLRVVQRQ